MAAGQQKPSPFLKRRGPWGRSSGVCYCAKFDLLTLLETNEERPNEKKVFTYPFFFSNHLLKLI